MTVNEGNCNIQFLSNWMNKNFFRFLNTVAVGVRCYVSLGKLSSLYLSFLICTMRIVLALSTVGALA